MKNFIATLFLVLICGFSCAQTDTYEITVVTPKRANAGTSAKVFIEINGTDNSTTSIHLDNNENNFEQGDVDRFSVELPNLGNIKSAVLFHNNARKKPGWYCESVKIRNARTGEVWFFDVNKWFTTRDGDGKIRRTIYPKK